MPIKRVLKGRIEKSITKKTVVKSIPKKEISKPEIKEKKNTSKTIKKDNYSAKNITVLEGLDAVRKRPGMYIGSTGEAGLHHLIWEVVDNAIDEAMGGYCNNIDITLMKNHWISVTDNGRGIPVDIHPTKKISALELVLTQLHAGGKLILRH